MRTAMPTSVTIDDINFCLKLLILKMGAKLPAGAGKAGNVEMGKEATGR